MPSLRAGGGHGDQYVELVVETPRNMSARQKELMREFCECSEGDCHPDSASWVGRVKKFWDDLSGGDESRPH